MIKSLSLEHIEKATKYGFITMLDEIETDIKDDKYYRFLLQLITEWDN